MAVKYHKYKFTKVQNITSFSNSLNTIHCVEHGDVRNTQMKSIIERIGDIEVNLTFTAKSEPECKTFLKIKKDGTYFTIDKFTEKFLSDSDDTLNDCLIWYRGIEKSYQQMTDDYVTFSESLSFYNFREPILVLDKPIQATIYFAKRA